MKTWPVTPTGPWVEQGERRSKVTAAAAALTGLQPAGFNSYSLLVCLCRGHTVRAVCESFHLAKDGGFKVVAHMMPDLPNVGMERDVEQFIVSVFLFL